VLLNHCIICDIWLQIIAKYLPTENPKLIPAVYELVLYEFLNTDIPVSTIRLINIPACIHVKELLLTTLGWCSQRLPKFLLAAVFVCLQLFLEFLERWDNSLYDSQTVVNAVLTFSKSDPNISKEDKRIIYECLAVLYTNQLKFSEALTVYLR